MKRRVKFTLFFLAALSFIFFSMPNPEPEGHFKTICNAIGTLFAAGFFINLGDEIIEAIREMKK